MARHDGATPPHPVLTDEPGLMLKRPRWQLAKILVLYALLALVCGAAGAVIAYQLSNVVTERRVAALEDDLAQRRAANAAGDEARDAQLGQTRRDLCVVIDRVQPRDAAVEDMRTRYGCTSGPAVTPTPGVSPSPARTRAAPTTGGGSTGRAPSGGQRGGSDAAGPTGPAEPGAPGRPAPPPPAPPAPPADGPTDLLDV